MPDQFSPPNSHCTGPASVPAVQQALLSMISAAHTANAALRRFVSQGHSMMYHLDETCMIRMGLPRRAGLTCAAVTYGNTVMEGNYLYLGPLRPESCPPNNFRETSHTPSEEALSRIFKSHVGAHGFPVLVIVDHMDVKMEVLSRALLPLYAMRSGEGFFVLVLGVGR